MEASWIFLVQIETDEYGEELINHGKVKIFERYGRDSVMVRRCMSAKSPENLHFIDGTMSQPRNVE